jgi:preprotein translocase subunit SecE
MATQQVQTVNTTADKAKLAASVALVVAALVAYYLLSKQGSIAQWGGLLVGLGAALVVFFSSEPASNWLLSGAMPGAKSRRSSGPPARRPSR